MGGFQEQLAELKALGADVIAASTSTEEKAAEGAADLTYPVAYGVTRAQADTLGSWWEERRSIIQPSDFVVDGEGKVLSATYSTGPVGRLEASDAVKFIAFQKKLREG